MATTTNEVVGMVEETLVVPCKAMEIIGKATEMEAGYGTS